MAARVNARASSDCGDTAILHSMSLLLNSARRSTVAPRSSRATAALALSGCVLVACTLSACAQPIPVSNPEPAPAPQPTRAPTRAPVRARAQTSEAENPALPYRASRWPIKTSEHVDLWLHAFAMVSNDTTKVPLFRRGYRDSLTVEKNRANLLTSLDVNRGTLAKRLASSPSYLQAQFVPFGYANWEEMRVAAERFLTQGDDPRRTPDRSGGALSFAALFPTTADREWLRLFLNGVTDEQARFFNAEHTRVIRTRHAVISAVDSLWQGTYRARFDRFLNNTSQRNGDVVLSIPVGGEGRTGVGRDRQTVVAVPLPGRVQDAADALFVLAHEFTGTLVTGVIGDNTTPAEQRSGAADRYISLGQVRAGALLLERVAPELLDGYMRFYLTQSGVRADAATPTGTLKATFASTFDIPAAIRDGISRQIDIVLGGI